VRDRLKVDLVKCNEFVGKEMECPADPSLRWFATGQFDEAGFGVPVEFPIVLTVGLAAMNRRQPSLSEGFSRSIRRPD